MNHIKIIGTVFLLATAPFSPETTAAPLDCKTLQQAIEAKLKNNNVNSYTLDIINADTPTTAKIVGSCNGRTHRISYTKNTPSLPVKQHALSGNTTLPNKAEPLVDESGFINVWALRKAVSKAAAVPTGDYDCNGYEGDGEEETPRLTSRKAQLAYARKRKEEKRQAGHQLAQCEKERDKAVKSYVNARTLLNQTWLPVLVSATKAGDPVAEVVLRLCETAPMLDRSGIASDCSDNPHDKVIARQRLESIDFKPALHRYTVTSDGAFSHESAMSCATLPKEKQTACRYQGNNERYQRILALMKIGFVSVAESWNTCQDKGETAELDRIVEECQRLRNMMMAVSSEVPRFYTAGPLENQVDFSHGLTLARPAYTGLPGTPKYAWPYNSRGVVERNDRSKFSDPEFQTKFYAELSRTIQTTESNIDADLRKDQRWAVFLIERITGRLYDAANTGAPNRPSPEAIKQYNENTPQAKAAREQADIAHWRSADIPELITSLHTSRNTRLYYLRDQFPANLIELEQRDGAIPALVAAYYADKDDSLFRFNIIMVLSHKLKDGKFSAHERDIVGNCLVDSLKESDPWIKTEGVWGLRFTRDKKYEAAARTLVNDSDKWVSSEARQSAAYLSRVLNNP